MADDTSETSGAVASPSMEDQMLASLDKVIGEPTTSTDAQATGKSKPAAKVEAKTDESAEEETDDTEHDESEDTTDDKDASQDDEETPDAGEESDEETEEDEDEPPALDPEFVDAMRKKGITADLSDLPPELRPILEQKVKAMDAGYTRVRQELASFRKEKADFDAEKAYQSQNPHQYIADLLAKDPSLSEKVNAELERRQDPTYASALQMQRDAAQKLAQAEAAGREQSEAARQAEVDSLDAYAEQAIQKAGIPPELVADALTLMTHQAVAANRLPTQAEIDAVIQRHADTYKKHVGAHKGATKRQLTREYVQSKKQEKAATSKAKPSSSIPTTIPRTSSQNGSGTMSLEDRMLATLESHGF